MKKIVIYLSLVLSGCTSVFDVGMQNIKSGNNQAAYDNFNSCASQGDSYCYNAIGWMFETNRLKSAEPLNDAVRYYTTAARYGNKAAQSNLLRLGYSIPEADLEKKLTPQEQQMLMQGAGDLGKSIGSALGRSVR